MTNANQPRRHHYITQSYQELFCTKIKKNKVFWVYDLDKKLWRKSQPLNEGVERDFQKLDHFIGLDPYFLEKSFAEIEGLAIGVIHKIALENSIPESLEEFSPVINLMGIFAGRNLSTRKMVNEILKRTSLKTLELIHKDEATYYAQMGKALADGAVEEPITPYQKSKDFLESRKFEIKTDPSIIVEQMAKGAAQITDLLGVRNWMLLEALGAEFITSNKPVNPVWAVGFATVVPRYELLNSIITFPITPKLALLGSWSPLPRYRKIDRLIVEGINWVTASSGATVLYAQSKSRLPIFEGVFHLQDFHRLQPTRLIEKSNV